MDWPGNYLDLNPIENCWGYLKSKLKNERAVTSLPKLIKAIKMMRVKDARSVLHEAERYDALQHEKVLANTGT